MRGGDVEREENEALEREAGGRVVGREDLFDCVWVREEVDSIELGLLGAIDSKAMLSNVLTFCCRGSVSGDI